MKKLFFYLILNLSISFIVTGSLNAQIDQIWIKNIGYAHVVGCANMDNDPQEEIVCWDNTGQLFIVDGLKGTVDWDSGYDRYDSGVIPDFPFFDLGNGLKGFVFEAKDNTSNVKGLCVVGLKGGVGKIEAQKIFVPEENKLSQNYPNPFNPDTKINYTVQQAGVAEIKIYNSLGQLVKTIVNEYKPMGEYEVVWDGKTDDGLAVSSGAYFYQLKVGDFVSSKKMLLLK